MSEKRWRNMNGSYYLMDTSSEIDGGLPRAIYNLEQDEKGNLMLRYIEDEFSFGFKVYGLERAFIDKIKTWYHASKGNVGVLLNGTKGTGKTVTAEILANELNLPIILIPENYKGLIGYLAQIDQDAVIFIDEYEKTFHGMVTENDYDRPDEVKGDTTLLGIMDGTYSTSHRKVFLLTTNKKYLNDNLLNRPGRIRYIKEFNDLTRAQIMEIIDDCLQDKSYTEDIISYLKPLEIITVDIVKAIINEVNVFKQPPEKCCENINVFRSDIQYKMTRTSGKKGLIGTDIQAAHVSCLFNEYSNWGKVHIHVNGESLRVTHCDDFEKKEFRVEPYHNPKPGSNFRIKLEEQEVVHKVFSAF